MRFFLDTEFIEDGRTIDPLSIALVGEDGSEYYAETELVGPILQGVATNVPEWVEENVVPHLKGGRFIQQYGDIQSGLTDFVGDEPEFWAYFADYDWVLLCQIFGRMIDLPPGWPMYCCDLRQALDERGLYEVKAEPTDEDGPAHDALADARANFRIWYRHVRYNPLGPIAFAKGGLVVGGRLPSGGYTGGPAVTGIP